MNSLSFLLLFRRITAISLVFFASLPLLRADDGDSPLEKQMQTLARGTKQLFQQVADPAQQQATISLIESLKTAVTNSKGLDPRKTASIPPSDREKFLADYHAQLDKLTAAYNQIEDAVKAGRYDQAKSLISTLGPIKKEGHAKFKQD